MAPALPTRSPNTRGLCLILSLMCLACIANSVAQKEKLEEIREQVKQVERLIEFWKARIQSERQSIFEIMRGNVERMKCIRQQSLLPVHQIEQMEDYTDKTNTHVRRSFVNIAAIMQEQESRLEDMKALLKYAELFPFEWNQMMF